jgi:glycosyltransferase involved in cell wall biosynthesis
LKILFITSLLGKQYGGAEVSTRLLMDKLLTQGLEVKALTTRKVKDDNRLIPINFPIEIPKKFLTVGNGQVDFFLARKIRAQLKQIKPDVIHIQDTYILPAAVAANRHLKVPSVATIRNSVLDETWAMMFPRPFSTLLAWRNKTILKALQEIDCTVSVSEYIKTELVQRGIDSKKVLTIYNLPPAFKTPKTQTCNKNDGVVHLLAPGQLETFKGFSVLIDAMKALVLQNSNVHLIIAGDGSQKKNLEKQVKKLQLQRYIEFTGKIPFAALSQLYTDCDIVVFPSTYAEPFGRVALEAAYFSKPIVASKVGGIPEVVEDKETGLLVCPGDSSELTASIRCLVEDSNLRGCMAKKGKAFVENKFSSERILAAHLGVYEKITLAKYT